MAASQQLIAAAETCCGGANSIDAQAANLEAKKQKALKLAKQRLDDYGTKLRQLRGSLATLTKEKRKLEADRRARDAAAAARRESCAQDLTAKFIELARRDQELLRLMKERVQLDHSIRTTVHQNRVAERDYKVKNGALSNDLDTNRECVESLAKFEPALEQSRATVAAVRDAARTFIDGVKSNVAAEVAGHKRNAISKAVGQLELYCKTKRAHCQKYFRAGNNKALEERKLRRIGLELNFATESENFDEVVDLGQQQRQVRARIAKHEAVQDDQQERWRVLDGTIEPALQLLGERLYAPGALNDEHSQALKRRVGKCVRILPPKHPKDDLERQVHAAEAKRHLRLIKDRELREQEQRRIDSEYAEEQQRIAMLEDRAAGGPKHQLTEQAMPAGGPEEGVPP